MNLRRLTARAVGVGATVALATGALVGISTSAAQAAAPGPVAYGCSLAGKVLPILVTPTGTLPSRLTAGDSVAANSETFTMTFTVPRAVLDGLAPFGISEVGMSTDNFAFGVGSTSIPVTGLAASKTAVPDTGDLVLPVTGKNGAFTAPGAGTYDLTMPSTFDAVVTTDASAPLNSLPTKCTITDAATAPIGSVEVVAGPQGAAYNCAFPGGTSKVYVKATDVPDFGQPASGSSVPAGQDLGVNYTIPAAAAALLAPATSAAFGSSDFALRLGGAGSVPFDALTSGAGAIVPGDDLVLPAASASKAFVAPAQGTYDIKLPQTFTGTLTPTGASAVSGACTIADDSSSTIGSMTVTAAPKQSSTTTATAPKTIKKGKTLKIAVTVTTANPATGKVTAKEGSKSLGSATLSGGKATISVKGLKPGKHTIKVSYAGDATTNGSTSKPVTVTVKK